MIQHWYISIASSVYLESVFLCPEMAKIETLRCSDVLWTVYFSLQSVTDSRQNKDKKKTKMKELWYFLWWNVILISCRIK